jgi:hypothetical protein
MWHEEHVVFALLRAHAPPGLMVVLWHPVHAIEEWKPVNVKPVVV